MIKSKGGSVINMASILGTVGEVGLPHSCCGWRPIKVLSLRVHTIS